MTNGNFDSPHWAVRINIVAVSSIQSACKVSLKWVKEPLDSDGNIVKDSCEFAHKQVKSWREKKCQIFLF